MIRTTCPYCNSLVTLPEPPAGKTPCPRCGQAFAVTAFETVEAQAQPAPAGRSPEQSRRRLWTVAITAGITSAVVTSVVWFAFLRPQPVVPLHRPLSTPRATGTVPPAAISSLTLLPSSSNIVFAVQPGQAGTDPDQLLAKLGVPADVTTRLKTAGVELSQVEHLVGGVTVAGDNLFPGLAVVLKLRTPLVDEDRFLKALQATKQAKAGRPTYNVAVGLPLTLVKYDDTTYWFGFPSTDPPADRGPVPLKDVLAERLSPASFAWVATADDAWVEKPAGKWLVKTRKELGDRLAGLRQVVISMSREPEPRLRATVVAADEKTAAALRADWKAKLPGATVAGDGRTVTADAAADAVEWRKLILGEPGA